MIDQWLIEWHIENLTLVSTNIKRKNKKKTKKDCNIKETEQWLKWSMKVLTCREICASFFATIKRTILNNWICYANFSYTELNEFAGANRMTNYVVMLNILCVRFVNLLHFKQSSEMYVT